jgi:hypothetical protein
MVRVLDPDHDLDVMLAGRAVLLIATLVLLHGTRHLRSISLSTLTMSLSGVLSL